MLLFLACALLWVVVATLVSLGFGRAARLGERDGEDVSRAGARGGEGSPRPGSPTCIRCGAAVDIWCICRRALCARCATVHLPACRTHRDFVRHLDEEHEEDYLGR
jgi:hypothetical protein